jgi:hypothetical protein
MFFIEVRITVGHLLFVSLSLEQIGDEWPGIDGMVLFPDDRNGTL